VPQTYCQQYGTPAHGSLDLTVSEDSSRTSATKGNAKDIKLADVMDRTLGPFNNGLDDIQAFVLDNMVCVVWKTVGQIEFPMAGKMRVRLDIHDYNLPLGGDKLYVISGDYDLMYKTGTAVITITNGPPPVVENYPVRSGGAVAGDGDAWGHHITVSSPTAIVNLEAFDRELNFKKGNHMVNATRFMDIQLMMPRKDKIVLGTPSIQKLDSFSVTFFMPSAVDNDRILRWEVGMAIAGSATDITEFKHMDAGVHRWTGLLPNTAYRMVFRSIFIVKDYFEWIKEFTTDAPVDPFGLPTWACCAPPMVFSVNKTRVVIRVPPYSSPTSKPVKQVAVTVREAVFHQSLLTQILPVGDTLLPAVSEYNYDIEALVEHMDGRITPFDSHIRGKKSDPMQHPVMCEPKAMRRSATEVEIMTCQKRNVYARDTGATSVSIFNARTSEHLFTGEFLVPGNHIVQGIEEGITLKVDFATKDVKMITFLRTEMIEPPTDYNAPIVEHGEQYYASDGAPTAEMKGGGLVEVICPTKRDPVDRVKALYCQIKVMNPWDDTVLASGKTGGGKHALKLPRDFTHHSSVNVEFTCVYEDEPHEPEVKTEILSMYTTGGVPLVPHVGTVRVYHSGTGSIVVQIPSTVNTISTAGGAMIHNQVTSNCHMVASDIYGTELAN
jgi:hypothetical protein